MSLNAVQDIRETEARGEAIIQEARQKAKEIVLKAEEEAYRLVEESAQKAREQGEGFLEETRIEAEKKVLMLMEENNSTCLELENQAKDKLGKAVSFIMERIVKPDGDS